MLAACAARLQGVRDLVWVDLGGGTGVRLDMPLLIFSRVFRICYAHPMLVQDTNRATPARMMPLSFLL